MARPDMAVEILGMTAASLETVAEDEALRRVDPSLFGWQRYVPADIEVLNAGSDFATLDFTFVIELQLGQRAHGEANIEASVG